MSQILKLKFSALVDIAHPTVLVNRQLLRFLLSTFDYSGSRLDALQSDLSPKRRKALRLTPNATRVGTVLVRSVFHTIENRYIN